MLNNKIIIHVSEVEISQTGGMGRIEWNWKSEFEKRGYTFIHIGPKEVGGVAHPGLFPYKAYRYFKRLNIQPLLFIIHEPCSGLFINEPAPVFIESHGIEQRYWELCLKQQVGNPNLGLKTRLLFPIWRLRNCNKGIKNANFLLLSNHQDAAYVQLKFNVSPAKIFIFKNGFNPVDEIFKKEKNETLTIVFNASWIQRKGNNLMIELSKRLLVQNITVKYLLIGTGSTIETILSEFPDSFKKNVTVIPSFEKSDEVKLLSQADLFVLPSYYEGQPLSLVQAMSIGLCCISTDNCGQKDLIKSGINGFLFETGNIDQMTDLVIKCSLDRPMVEKIGAQAREDMRSRTWDAVNIETVDFMLQKVN